MAFSSAGEPDFRSICGGGFSRLKSYGMLDWLIQ